MWLKNIQILNFRNFSRLNLNFSPTLNVIEGGNSQGKTNLLEAIYCMGRGVSFRTHEDRSLIKWNQDGFYVGGEGEKRGSFFKFELSLAQNSNKLRRVNSHRVSIKNAKYWLWMVVFSTLDMKIVQGGPFHRRNFLDEVASFLYPGFAYLRFSFNKVLHQRNALLSQIRENERSYNKQMAGWSSQFLNLGSELVYRRLGILRKLALNLSKIYPRLRGENCRLHLVYNSSFLEAQNEGFCLERVRGEFRRRLQVAREKEIERGVSLIGPHRDDFQMKVDGIDQRVFGSQGEQRALAIALKLAEVELIRGKENEVPIILLDDVPADLDPQREKFLLSEVKKKGQILLATQDGGKLGKGFLDKSLVFSIRDGRVRTNEAG